MAYIDETYGKQLEEALRGLVSRPALGQPWFGFHESEVPAGVLLFTATTHSRVLYADFWNYIQNKNLVKTEEEWQSIYAEQGWCPFYSDGDGIDTFRMPSAPLYLHGANTLSEAGKYTEAGLPELKGSFNAYTYDTGNPTGIIKSSTGAGNALTFGSSEGTRYLRFDINAALTQPIYGNSDTVTPETSKMLFGVWAISAPQQPIPDATVEGIISELGIASNNALEAKNGLIKAVPVGTVIAFAANVNPEGFLLCNGAMVSMTTYADLFDKIGIIYGVNFADGKFALPNLIDRFIQGSEAAGTLKNAGLPNISGYFNARDNTVSDGTPTGFFAGSGGCFSSEKRTSNFATSQTQSSNDAPGEKLSFDASRSSSIYGNSTTVQPPALTMRYYIKY